VHPVESDRSRPPVAVRRAVQAVGVPSPGWRGREHFDRDRSASAEGGGDWRGSGNRAGSSRLLPALRSLQVPLLIRGGERKLRFRLDQRGLCVPDGEDSMLCPPIGGVQSRAIHMQLRDADEMVSTDPS